MRYIINIILTLSLSLPFLLLAGEKETITIRSLFPAPGGAINTTENANLAVGDDNKKVGIGTDKPQSKLDVEGGVAIGVGYSGTNTAPANGLIVKGTVGIGTPNPSAELDVIGTIKASAGLIITGGDVSLPDSTIGSSEITDGAITQNKLAIGAVGTNEIQDGAVTRPKLSNSIAGQGLSFTGNSILVNTGPGLTITNNAVQLSPPSVGTGITYSCPSNLSVDSYGRITSCTSNCGGGGGGDTPEPPAGKGTANYVPLWGLDGNTLGDSIISQPAGTSININGSLDTSAIKLTPTDDINPSSNCSDEGKLYYDNSDNTVYLCAGSNWQPIAGNSYCAQTIDHDADGHIAKQCGGTDCHDNLATIYLGAHGPEYKDLIDNDCDGEIDEAVVTASSTFNNPRKTVRCEGDTGTGNYNLYSNEASASQYCKEQGYAGVTSWTNDYGRVIPRAQYINSRWECISDRNSIDNLTCVRYRYD